MNLAYSPWGTGDTVGPFASLFKKSWNAFEKGLDGADCFILWGGTDIHPSFYNQTHHRYNQAGKEPSKRDLWEWAAMKECKEKNIPVIGICRGAQFLCAFNGGSLYQHVDNHTGGNHKVTTSDGNCFSVTSCHHQMLNVKNIPHEMLAWTTHARSTVYQEEGDTSVKVDIEPEIVYFPQNNSLAIQGHPEWASESSEFVLYCLQEVSDKLLSERCIC
jgi:gamma-glutamyl-gamma-aminobutyrate hydrolase PuuD